MTALRLAVVVGFPSLTAAMVLGTVPFFYEHLHWYLWGFVPITGMLLGGLLAYSQNRLAPIVSLRISLATGFILALSAPSTYFATDVVRYYSLVSEKRDSSTGMRTTVPLYSRMSLSRFLGLTYGAIEILDGDRTVNIRLDAHGHRVLRVVDFGLCFMMACLLLHDFARKREYCARCASYMSQTIEAVHVLPDGDLSQERALNRCLALIKGHKIDDLIQIFATDEAPTNGEFSSKARLALERAACSTCGLQVMTMMRQVLMKADSNRRRWIDGDRWPVSRSQGREAKSGTLQKDPLDTTADGKNSQPEKQ